MWLQVDLCHVVTGRSVVISDNNLARSDVMDIASELFGTSSGWMVIIVLLIMLVGIPGVVWWTLGHTKVSECEVKDKKAHPGQ
ncbi:MAG TPA: hypothetical protein DF427_06905 [Moraxellaceae bacterium]|nr:hypothetical protein [Moraxellaceae bacterium]